MASRCAVADLSSSGRLHYGRAAGRGRGWRTVAGRRRRRGLISLAVRELALLAGLIGAGKVLLILLLIGGHLPPVGH